MAEYSRPWSGTSGTDAGPYSADDWQRMYEYILGGKPHKFACLIPDSGDEGVIPLRVNASSPASTVIRVQAGAAVVNGTFYYADAYVEKTISANASGNARIDTVCLEWDSSDASIRVTVVEGTPAASPSAPTLTDSSTIKQVPLADIAVANGFSTITESNITLRAKPLQFNNLDLQVFQNNSGADIAHGYIVEHDTANDRSVQVSDASVDAFAVTFGDIPDNEWGLVFTHGISTVYCDEAATRGNALCVSPTDGQVTAETNTNQIRIADALETTTGAGYVLAYVRIYPRIALNRYEFTGGGYTTTSTSDTELDATNTSTNMAVRTGKIKITLHALGMRTASVSQGQLVYFTPYIDAGADTTKDTQLTNDFDRDAATFTWIITGLSEGAHDIDMYWKAQGGGYTTFINSGVIYVVEEIL